nr:helix-turn-helix transcriptional regulator [uncultured Oscillibacter sp.]
MFKPDMKALGARMAQAGISSGKELAERSGVSVNTISRLNNGGSAKLPTIKALAAALGCSPENLIQEGE